ncbi:putative RNA-binding protein 46, partial [Corchorus olitorius]
QQPVEEVHARQAGRHFAAFLVHIVAAAGHVGIVADHDEGLRARRCAAPGKVRIAVGRQRHVGCRIGHGEREFAGDGLAVLEALAGELHVGWILCVEERSHAARSARQTPESRGGENAGHRPSAQKASPADQTECLWCGEG